jgi:glycine cleavage system aminomethyltransferase T
MEYGTRLWETLWAAGQPEGMVAAGYKAIDTLRLEKGYRYWGADISPDYSPYETGMGFAVKLNKGDFLGKAALVKQKAEGIKQKLCCFSLSDPTVIALGNEPILKGDKVVGWITSGGYGYSVKKSIACGYLPIEDASWATGSTDWFGADRIKVEADPLATRRANASSLAAARAGRTKARSPQGPGPFPLEAGRVSREGVWGEGLSVGVRMEGRAAGRRITNQGRET